VAGDGRRSRAEDLPAAPDLHGRRPARLRADGPALSELVERIREGYEAFNRGDFDAAIEGVHPEIEWIVLDMLPDPGPFRGPDGTRRFWEMWADAFDEFHAELDEYVDAGESVIVITRMVGRGKDSGVAVDTPGFPMVWTTRDNVIVRVEMFDSREKALAAAGLPPDTPFENF
jgi:ketosteroid isomerase-like protein